jgi:hypothetical protein
VAEDPIGIDAGINAYTYVWGNPLTLSDPEGSVGVLGGVIILGGLVSAYMVVTGIADAWNAAENVTVMQRVQDNEVARSGGDAMHFNADRAERAQRERYGDIRDATRGGATII